MSHVQPRPETLEHALAQTKQIDERDEEFWLPLILQHGYAVHFGDEHGIGRQLPYAMIVIDVEHVQNNDFFSGPVDDTRAALEHPVIIFADELHNCAKALPSNRQSDGNIYIYKLYSLEHHVADNVTDFAALPTGDYKLEILVPLFKVEPIIATHGRTSTSKAYRVSTSGYVYDSEELEAGNGFMGVVTGPDVNVAPRGSVWKLLRKPTNVTRDFANEMCRRQWAFNFEGEDSHEHEDDDSDEPKVKLEEFPDGFNDIDAGAAAVMSESGLICEAEAKNEPNFTTRGSKHPRSDDNEDETCEYDREAKRIRC